MTMKKIVAQRLAPVTPTGVYETTVPMSSKESSRNYLAQSFLGGKNFMGNVVTRVVLPQDGKSDDSIRKAQAARVLAERRQLAMPWLNTFMVTATDAQRLNNPAQQSFVSQRQLTTPSTYGQFYAFMHALSAAFGNVQ